MCLLLLLLPVSSHFLVAKFWNTRLKRFFLCAWTFWLLSLQNAYIQLELHVDIFLATKSPYFIFGANKIEHDGLHFNTTYFLYRQQQWKNITELFVSNIISSSKPWNTLYFWSFSTWFFFYPHRKGVGYLPHLQQSKCHQCEGILQSFNDGEHILSTWHHTWFYLGRNLCLRIDENRF